MRLHASQGGMCFVQNNEKVVNAPVLRRGKNFHRLHCCFVRMVRSDLDVRQVPTAVARLLSRRTVKYLLIDLLGTYTTTNAPKIACAGRRPASCLATLRWN